MLTFIHLKLLRSIIMFLFFACLAFLALDFIWNVLKIKSTFDINDISIEDVAHLKSNISFFVMGSQKSEQVSNMA